MSAFDVEYAYQRGYQDGIGRAPGLSLEMFCRCADALRKYWNWENQLYNMGVDLTDAAPGGLADTLMMVLGDGDLDWAYDKTAEINWLAVWCSASETRAVFEREFGDRYQRIYLPEADDLYAFVQDMRRYDWPEELPEKWRY